MSDRKTTLKTMTMAIDIGNHLRILFVNILTSKHFTYLVCKYNPTLSQELVVQRGRKCCNGCSFHQIVQRKNVNTRELHPNETQ